MTEHAAEHDYHAEHPDWPADFEPGTEQDLAVGTIVYVTVVGTIITVLIVLLLKQMFFEAHDHEFELKNYETIYQPQIDLRESQQKQLSGYGWRDARAGVITIPIELAMSQVVDEYQQGRHDEAPAAPAAAPATAGEPAAAEGAAAVETAPADAAAGNSEDGQAAPETHAEAAK